MIAVDSAPHVVAPADAGERQGRGSATRCAASSRWAAASSPTPRWSPRRRWCRSPNKGTRHIVLFADAADAEEPGDYKRLLEKLTPLGITVSVIGLGQRDGHRRGVPEGRRRARQGAHLVHRQAPKNCRACSRRKRSPSRDRASSPSRRRRATLPDMVLLGETCRHRHSPSVDGYNLTYLRPGATMGVVTTDEYKRAGAGVLASRARPRRVAHRRSGRRVFAAAERVARISGIRRRARPVAAGRRAAGRRAGDASSARGRRASCASNWIPARTRGGADDVRAAAATMVSARHTRRSCF